MKYKSEPKGITAGGARKYPRKVKNRSMKFDQDSVSCEVCNKSYPTNRYKTIMPMAKKLPKSHLPDHKCKGDK